MGGTSQPQSAKLPPTGIFFSLTPPCGILGLCTASFRSPFCVTGPSKVSASLNPAAMHHGTIRDCGRFKVQVRSPRFRTTGRRAKSLFFGISQTKRTNQGDEAIENFNSIQASEVKLKGARSEEHTSELQSQFHLVCRLLLEKKKLKTSRKQSKKKKKNIVYRIQ